MPRFLLPLFAIMLLLSGCGPSKDNGSTEVSSTEMPATETSAVSKGQQLFLSHCASCHQGPGNPPTPNEVVMNSMTLNQESSFQQLIRKPNSPMMRAFTPEELSNADIHELYAYVHGLRTPKAP